LIPFIFSPYTTRVENLDMHPSRARQIADALEDDYVHDDLVALSGDEDAGDLVPDDDESGDVSGGSSPEEGKTQEADAAASAKKRKRREKEKERKAKARPDARSSMCY
jgi:protein CMS1